MEVITSKHEGPGAPSEAVLRTLVAERGRFFAFLVQRVGDPDTAEDLLQTAIVRALGKADSLQDEERVVAWIYRILRNVLTDYARNQAAGVRAVERTAYGELPEIAPPDVEAEICACVAGLVTTLSPEHAEILRLVELDDMAPTEAADELGLSAGAARVRLHRARAALRERVEQLCRTCARHGCLDCTCGKAGR